MGEITSISATRLAELIRQRAVSPLEVAEAFLHRIEEINPTLNAIVTLSPKLLDHAREAESALLRGDALGPLHGVPVTIKDTIETAGLRTTSGSPLRPGHITKNKGAAGRR